MKEYECFNAHLSIKRHFQRKEYWIAKGNVVTIGRVKYAAIRNHTRHLYKKLASQGGDIILRLACFVYNTQNAYINKIFLDEAVEDYVDTRKILDSLYYTVCVDIKQFDTLISAIRVTDGKSQLHTAFLEKKVCKETLIALNSAYNYFDYWERNLNLTIDYDWAKDKLKLMKFGSFMVLDKEIVKKLELLFKNN